MVDVEEWKVAIATTPIEDMICIFFFGIVSFCLYNVKLIVKPIQYNSETEKKNKEKITAIFHDNATY